jgi:hypothetical protein
MRERVDRQVIGVKNYYHWIGALRIVDTFARLLPFHQTKDRLGTFQQDVPTTAARAGSSERPILAI